YCRYAYSVLDEQVSQGGTINQDDFILDVPHVVVRGFGEATRSNENSLSRFLPMQRTNKRLNFLAADLAIVPTLSLQIDSVEAEFVLFNHGIYSRVARLSNGFPKI